jgi:hypothetical protein
MTWMNAIPEANCTRRHDDTNDLDIFFESNPIYYDEIARLILIDVISVGIVLLMGFLEHLQG